MMYQRMMTMINGRTRRLRELGPEQRQLLKGFLEHGTWHRDENWTGLWPSDALRLIKSLQQRGLIYCDGDSYGLTNAGLLEARDQSERSTISSVSFDELFGEDSHSFHQYVNRA
jgi:hypothetical protein